MPAKRTHKTNIHGFSLKERTTIQLQTGPTKAYVKRNPMAQKLKPLNGDDKNMQTIQQDPVRQQPHRHIAKSADPRYGNRFSSEFNASRNQPMSASSPRGRRPQSQGKTQDTNNRSQSEMQWTPIVNITRNNTFILPSMSVERPVEPPCFPRIDIPECDSEDEDNVKPEKQKFADDMEESDRNLLLQYLKKGARPSITPMNSVDSESTDDQLMNPESVADLPKFPGPSKPVMSKSTSQVFSSSSSIRVHCPVLPSRRPQVLTRVSVGEDLDLQFCRGSRPAQSYTLPQWSNNRFHHGRTRTSLPAFPSVAKQPIRKPMLRSSSTAHSVCHSTTKFNPSDQEIIDMYRKGLLSAKIDANGSTLPTSSVTDSQYCSPKFWSTPGLKEESVVSKNVTSRSPSVTSSEGGNNTVPLGPNDSGISRGATTIVSTGECDSRKPSDPNCLQIPDINCPVSTSDTSESFSDGPPNWDSKSSTPALREPHDFDSRPISCASSLGDASLMLENDDIASLPGSPFPGSVLLCILMPFCIDHLLGSWMSKWLSTSFSLWISWDHINLCNYCNLRKKWIKNSILPNLSTQ